MRFKLQYFALASILLLPAITFAQQTLVNIPGLNGDGFNGYINALYAMFISIAALLAVVKLIIAGVKYMFSDIVTQKSEAKNDIKGALLGLVVVLAAVLILTVINPNLTNFNLDGIEQTPRAERPATTPENTINQSISDACEDSPENCEITVCSYTGRVRDLRCDNNCRNNNGIPLEPTGSGLPPRCLGSISNDTGDLVEEAVNNEAFCGTAGCYTFTARGLNGSDRCTTLNGSLVTENSRFWGEINTCVVPRLNLSNDSVELACVDSTGQPYGNGSCSIQEDLCEDVSNGFSEISFDEVTGSRTVICSGTNIPNDLDVPPVVRVEITSATISEFTDLRLGLTLFHGAGNVYSTPDLLNGDFDNELAQYTAECTNRNFDNIHQISINQGVGRADTTRIICY